MTLSKTFSKALLIGLLATIATPVHSFSILSAECNAFLKNNYTAFNTALSVFDLAASALYDEALIDAFLQCEDADEDFTQWVYDEFADMDIENPERFYVKYSSHPQVEQDIIIGCPHGIVIAESIHTLILEHGEIVNTIQFLVRREGSHLKHNDYFMHRIAGLLGYIAIHYGGSAAYNAMKNPCAKPTSFDTFTDDHWFITHTIKDCMLFAAINKYRFTMEKRADEEAASTKELAEAGVQIYTNIKHLIVDQKPGLAFLERNTWLKSPSYAERIEYLEARVHDFAVEEALEHFYASRAAHMTDEGDDCAEEAEAL